MGSFFLKRAETALVKQKPSDLKYMWKKYFLTPTLM